MSTGTQNKMFEKIFTPENNKIINTFLNDYCYNVWMKYEELKYMQDEVANVLMLQYIEGSAFNTYSDWLYEIQMPPYDKKYNYSFLPLKIVKHGVNPKTRNIDIFISDRNFMEHIRKVENIEDTINKFFFNVPACFKQLFMTTTKRCDILDERKK